MNLKIHGDSLTLDFTGSDPQLVSSLNVPTGGNERHSLAMVGAVYALYSLDPTITLNYGLMLPVRAVLPEGSVMNPVKPAAVGMRSLMCNLLQVATIGAFCRVVPDRMPASPGSGMSIMNVKTSTRDGRPIMASIGPVSGGAGGGPTRDGAEGCGANMSYLKNTPVEINEAEVPILVRRYGLVPDSGGSGLYRGGSGMEMEFQLFAPQSMVTARNRDRSRFGAWGLAGGKPGLSSRFARNPDTPECVELGSIDIVNCEPGDIILIQGPGAGGYGDPLLRSAEVVRQDVARGFVSREKARADYGVVLKDDLTLDAEATTRLRAELKTEPVALATFGHNAVRIEYEKVWTLARYRALTEILAQLPISWRYFIKHQVFRAVGSTRPAEDDGRDIYDIFEQIRGRYKDLPAVVNPSVNRTEAPQGAMA